MPVWVNEITHKSVNSGFIENKGQIIDTDGNPATEVKFYLIVGNMTAYFTPNSIIYTFTKQNKFQQNNEFLSAKNQKHHQDVQKYVLTQYRNDMEFSSSSENCLIYGIEDKDELLNFYYSHCPEGVKGIKVYKEILYQEIYPNIDLRVYTKNGLFGFKYDFIVHPGGKPEQIKLNYSECNTEIESDGSVSLRFNDIVIKEGVPFTYQKSGIEQNEITSKFILKGKTLSFNVGEYNKREKLIIDPVINWSTYFGGGDGDHSSSIALDNQANVIIAGRTLSKNLPVTNGTTYIGEFDIFISKFDYTGKLLWSTYYGGKGSDYVGKAAIDPAAHIYITGWTWDKNFPVTDGCFQSEHLGGYNDGILAKFNRNGIREWATYVGGYSEEHLYGLDIDNSFNVIAAGWTKSSNFPNDSTPINPKRGFDDIVVVSFSSNGDYQWSTHLGGDSIETANEAVIDYSGNINIIGSTHSRNFQVTPNAHQMFNNGHWDAVTAKFDINGNLKYASYFGGSNSDYGTSVTVDSLNSLYITGYTMSEDFPVTSNAYQKTKRGFINSFITKFSSTNSVLWSTYLGGSKEDYSYAVNIDRDGNPVVAGITYSSDFPSTINAVQGSLKGPTDAFGAKFTSDGKSPFWITYYGGDDDDQANDVAVDYYFNIYMTGDTKSPDFPVTSDAFQIQHAGEYDAFVFKHCATSPYTEIAISGKTTFCDGESVELDAGGGFLFYEWSSGETTQKITVTKSGSYTVHITDTMYCDFTTPPVIINVLPLPKPEIKGNPKYCEGDSAVLTVPTGYPYWKWSTGSTDETIVVKEDTEIILEVTDANGCTGYDTVQVSENPIPKPLIHGPNVVCVNSTNMIYYVYGKAGHTYHWEIVGGVINTGQDYFNIQVNWTTSGTGRIFITEVDNASGCTGYDTLEVEISDHLEPRIASDKGRFVMCEGDSLILDAGFGYKSYEWNTGSGSQYITVKNEGEYFVKVEASSDCVGYDTVFVSVRPVPQPIIQGDSVLCEGSDIIPYSSNYDSNHKYYWDIFGGTTIVDDSSYTISVVWDEPGTGRITLVQYDTLTECSGTAVYDVMINPKPIVSITPGQDTSFCEGDSILLDAGAGFMSYKWNTGDTLQTLLVKTEGTYKVTVTNQFECENSDSIRIDVWPRPAKPSITSIDDTLFSSPGDNYEWYRNDSLLQGVNAQWFVSEIDGNYTVIHKNQYDCASESEIYRYKYVPIVGLSYLSMPDSIFVKTGDPVVIPIIIESSNLLDKIEAYNFTAQISFNGSILIPDDLSIPFEKNFNIKTIQIEGTRTDTVGLIYTLEMHAALGDSVCTRVTIDTLSWESYRDVVVTSNSCVVCLTNICDAAGKRFFHNSGELRLEKNRPNPASGITYIEFEAIEEGRHVLKLNNIYGENVEVLFDRFISPGTFGVNLRTNNIPSGVYFYTLETPTQFRKEKMQIMK